MIPLKFSTLRFLPAAAFSLCLALGCRKSDSVSGNIASVYQKYGPNLVAIAPRLDHIEGDSSFDLWTGMIIDGKGLVMTSASLAERYPKQSEFIVIFMLTNGKCSEYKYRITSVTGKSDCLFLAPISSFPSVENVPCLSAKSNLAIGDDVLQMSILYKRLDRDFMRNYAKSIREVSIITFLAPEKVYVTSALQSCGMSGSPIFDLAGERLIGITTGGTSEPYSYADSYVDDVTSSGERVVFPQSRGAFHYSLFNVLVQEEIECATSGGK